MANFIPIRDRFGAVSLWLFGSRLIDLTGRSIGFVSGHNVFDYNGAHRALFIDGVIRDHYGAVVGHIDNAKGLTVIPAVPAVPPIPPIPSIEPIRPIPQLPPLPPSPKLHWSEYDPLGLFDL